MPTTLTTSAVEYAAFVITINFVDEDGNAFTPNAGLVWKLTDLNGTVINSRQSVAITPASSIKIVLQGADLPVTPEGFLAVTVEGTYDSTNGNNLPLKEEVKFRVIDLVAPTAP